RRFLDRLFGENWRNFGGAPRLERAALFVLGGLLFCGSLVALGIFFFRPPANEDPRWALLAAGVMLVLSAGACCLGLFYHLVKKSETRIAAALTVKPPADMPDLYLVYPDGLAVVTGERYEFMEWSAVQEVAWIWIRMARHLAMTDKDGHQLVVW